MKKEQVYRIVRKDGMFPTTYFDIKREKHYWLFEGREMMAPNNVMLADSDKYGPLEQYVGLNDRKRTPEYPDGQPIFEGDIVRIVLDDGEVRDFVVSIETVIREVVSHPSFDDETAKVGITGVVFTWEGFKLFPCVDENDIPDNCRIEVIGHIYEGRGMNVQDDPDN